MSRIPQPPPPSPRSSAGGAVHLDHDAIKALPANVTYRDLIAENKRKSVILIVIIMLLGIAVGGAAGVALGASGHTGGVLPSAIAGGVAFAVVVSIATLWSWFGGASAILSMAGAKPIEKPDDPQLFNVVEELAISGGLPMPAVYLIDDPSLNAFATGRDPAHAAIAITTGLRQSLTRDELAGVMAHELAHVRHYDIRLMMLMATLGALIVFAADLARRAMWFGGGRRSSRSDSKGGNPAAVIIFVLALVVLAIAPIVAMMLRFAISRQREYLADAGAVELTRYPGGLIGALEKLGACRQPLQRQNDAIAPLFIMNPAKNAVALGRQDASSVFMTHPPLKDRIDRLRALG